MKTISLLLLALAACGGTIDPSPPISGEGGDAACNEATCADMLAHCGSMPDWCYRDAATDAAPEAAPCDPATGAPYSCCIARGDLTCFAGAPYYCNADWVWAPAVTDDAGVSHAPGHADGGTVTCQ